MFCMIGRASGTTRARSSRISRKKPSDSDFAAISQFKSLNEEEMDNLKRRSWLHSCESGVFEFRNIESEHEDMYFMVRGSAFLYNQTQGGKSAVIRVFARGDFFSQEMLFSSELMIASNKNTKLLSVPVDFFQHFCNENPKVLQAHCKYFEDLHNRQLMFGILSSMESDSRVASFLRMHTVVNKELGMLTLSLGSLLHQQIADCTGLSRETITRKFLNKSFQNWKQLAKKGMIQISKEEIAEMGFD